MGYFSDICVLSMHKGMEQEHNDVVVFFDQPQVEGDETIEEVVECDESSYNNGILCSQCNTTFTSLTEHIETFHMGQKTNLEVSRDGLASGFCDKFCNRQLYFPECLESYKVCTDEL